MPKFLNTNNSISSSEFSSTYSNDIIIISKDVIFQVHDKTFKEILKSSYEMTDFLKTFIGLEVNSENLKIYNSSFITNNYKRRESDILYKDIIQNTFYLIEHQSTVNIDMPRRILEYSTELMREIKKNKIELKNPLIIPIVIYTGKQPWNIPTNFSDTQTFNSSNKSFVINQIYKLIDIHTYSIDKLKNIHNKISYMLLIEKCKNHLELAQTLEYIAIHANTSNTKEWVNNLVTYVFAKTLDDTSKSKILKLLYEKEKNENMEDLIERINNNIRLEKKKNIKHSINIGETRGKLENLFSTIKNMLNFNLTDEEIIKYTNATQEQIDQVRKKLK